MAVEYPYHSEGVALRHSQCCHPNNIRIWSDLAELAPSYIASAVIIGGSTASDERKQ